MLLRGLTNAQLGRAKQQEEQAAFAKKG